MTKLTATFIKEVLLLTRDRAGLAMLFIMPVALVLVMTLLQDSTFKQLEEKNLPILIVNHDADTFGLSIVAGLREAPVFEVIEDNTISNIELISQIEQGKYLIGIIIRSNSTRQIKQSIKEKIQSQFPVEKIGELFEKDNTISGLAKVEIYFDPILKTSYKQSILGALKQFSAMVEAKLMFEIYSGLFEELIDIELKPGPGFTNLVVFDEKYASSGENTIIPNSVQHNIPAWTIFAMFFIVIPLASNIIKERQSGVSARLKTIPGSYFLTTFGKLITYFLVGLVQAILMMVIGIWLLPVFGLPSLQIGNGGAALLIVTIAIILAATGYGIAIGTIASSEQQSSIFGSISVVILAAIGGVWVPQFMMSDIMINVSKVSPLSWGLNAYYDILLRNSGIVEVLNYIALLVIFFLLCISFAWYYNRIRKTS
jgi:ABC-2 type transport system permease protein